MPSLNTRWDIFCTVVDNYGDIGVTWRLARQLVAEHSLDVRLWVDDLRAFERICPEIDINAAQQWQQGVEVRHWPSEWLPIDAADVVIASFACQLPSAYMDVMAEREKPPLWLNLDYLSAEDWVTGCHGLPSVKYKSVQKIFFFPGFRPGTGGLLRERGCSNSVGSFSAMTRRSDNSCQVWARACARRTTDLTVCLRERRAGQLARRAGGWRDAHAFAGAGRADSR